jgi:hypothetical protein
LLPAEIFGQHLAAAIVNTALNGDGPFVLATAPAPNGQLRVALRTDAGVVKTIINSDLRQKALCGVVIDQAGARFHVDWWLERVAAQLRRAERPLEAAEREFLRLWDEVNAADEVASPHDVRRLLTLAVQVSGDVIRAPDGAVHELRPAMDSRIITELFGASEVCREATRAELAAMFDHPEQDQAGAIQGPTK